MRLILLALLILLLILRIFRKENFSNFYILSKEPKNNFYYRFIDYVLNERHPKDDSIIVQDKYGYKHLLDKRYDPRVINPMFIFDEYLWQNPNSFKVIPV
jgi:hypothetical protein